jgi:serine/threonine protein kinase/lipoprotein NlpI
MSDPSCAPMPEEPTRESIAASAAGPTSEPTSSAASTAVSQSTTGILAIGTLIDDHYEVLAHIGSGGMGEVYRVLDRRTDTCFALKMISPCLAEQKTLARRLEHEAQAARTLVHGNIVSVYDVGRFADGAPYLLMDYVEGEGLDAIMAKETVLTAARSLNIGLQIAEALVHAAQKQVVHRDLKPSNILLTRTPEGTEMVKIVDFGIAKISDQDKSDKTKLTQTGELLGTPLYMSPEQCTGDEQDARSDIYSFGCIMYEMLTGRSPFAAENPVKVILKHLSEEPPPLPAGVGISKDLKQIVMRCLEKLRADRYQTAVDLHIDLMRVLEGRPVKPYQKRRRVSGKNKSLAIAVTALLALAAAGGFYAFLNQPTAMTVRAQHRVEQFRGKNLAQWTKAIEASPNDPELYWSRGWLHSDRDERTNAIDDFTQAIELDPNYVDAYFCRGEAYILTAQYDKGRKDSNKLIAIAPHNPQGYQLRGWTESAMDEFGPSIKDWTFANSLQPDPWNNYMLAIDHMKLAQYEAAEAAAHRALSQNRGNSSYAGIAALIAVFQQNYAKAAPYIKAIERDPDARGVEWQFIAYYYFCLGKTEEAEHAALQAKTLETFPARGFRLAGEYYRIAGLYEKAIQEFSAATSLEEYPPGYREKAVTFIQMGQYRSAYNDLKKSLQLNPYSTVTLSYLALVENELGMKGSAGLHIKNAFQSGELPPIVYVNRATIELKNQQLSAALADANAALDEDRWLKEGYETRARILEAMHKTGEATKDKEKAQSLISHLDF